MTERGVDVPIPKSRDQARRLYSNDKIKTLVKLKVQEYIESFFDQNGENRGLLEVTSPQFINYNISKSFDPDTDFTQRKLQVARYFNELRNILPSILIVDRGIQAIPNNIGLISDSIIDNKEWRGYFPILRSVPVTIISAARDMETADEMSGLISIMFNELRNLAGGHYMTGKPEEAENWTISLPQNGVDVSALTEVEVPGDPVERIFYAETEMEVTYQDVLAVRKPLPEYQLQAPTIEEPSLKQRIRPVIVVDAQVSLNSQVYVRIKNLQDHYQIILSNGALATLAYNTVLTPRAPGKLTIRVIDPLEGDPDKNVLAEKEIEII
jgi:hypothetical protein